MKSPKWLVGLVLIAALSCAGNQVLAQDTEAKGGGDEAAMMKAMIEAAAPDANHARLKPLAGSWNCQVKFWHTMGEEPEVSTGTIVRKWILDGRFLAEDYTGTAMGMPFSGFGITGYDKNQKKYIAIWMDTMGTGFYTETGTCDASGKLFTFTGENFDPMIGGMKKTKSTLEIINNDKMIGRMFEIDSDGKERINFEMVTTRK